MTHNLRRLKYDIYKKASLCQKVSYKNEETTPEYSIDSLA